MLNFLLNCFRKKRQKAIPQPAVRKEPSESQLAKKEALQQAEQLSGDDLLIADFVLQCKFADARFIAARKIQSRDALGKSQGRCRQDRSPCLPPRANPFE